MRQLYIQKGHTRVSVDGNRSCYKLTYRDRFIGEISTELTHRDTLFDEILSIDVEDWDDKGSCIKLIKETILFQEETIKS